MLNVQQFTQWKEGRIYLIQGKALQEIVKWLKQTCKDKKRKITLYFLYFSLEDVRMDEEICKQDKITQIHKESNHTIDFFGIT